MNNRVSPAKGPDLAIFGGSTFSRGAGSSCRPRRCARRRAARPQCVRRSPCRQHTPFGMHLVIARVGCLNRQKSAGSDMKGECRPADPAAGECLQQSFGEVQSGCRRGHAHLGPGKHRLIIGTVARIAAARTLDVRRQRHRTVACQRLAECLPFKIEAQSHVALGVLLGDKRGEVPHEEDDVVADPEPSRALGKRAPGTAAEIAMERDLDRRCSAASLEPGRNHFSIVEDEQIARAQQLRQIRDAPVVEARRCRYAPIAVLPRAARTGDRLLAPAADQNRNRRGASLKSIPRQ